MYDSVSVASLPDGADLYGAYVDGRYNTYAAAVARFGTNKVVPIAVFSSTNAGIVGDCESGDMTPQTAVSWVVMRRHAGVDPTIYCSLAAWSAVQAAFTQAGVAQPHWWIAAYPGNGANLYTGAVAHQYADVGPNGENIDISVVADYWPGVDSNPGPTPIPTPTPSATSGEQMLSPVVSFKPAQYDMFQVSPGGVLYHKWSVDGGHTWANEALPSYVKFAVAAPQVQVTTAGVFVRVEDNGIGLVYQYFQAASGTGSVTWTVTQLP